MASYLEQISSYLGYSSAAPTATDAAAATTATAATGVQDGAPAAENGGYSSESWSKMLAGGCPVVNKESNAADNTAAMPGSPSEQTYNPDNQMMVEERQLPAPGQKTPLPTQRRTSSIPKGDFTPVHQKEDADTWQYPSQQMFFNAMTRKGYGPVEEEMSHVVGIHNAVNETTWRHVLEWEKSLHPETADKLKLKKFSGDAKNITPKARFMNLLGKELPFDRHDWIVERDGEPVHYVIDFYSTPNSPSRLKVEIDARPALDSVGGVVDRVRMAFVKVERAFSAGSQAGQAQQPPASAAPGDAGAASGPSTA